MTGLKIGCAEWKKLQADYEESTLRWGKYTESIEGSAKTTEHCEVLDKLEMKTRVALSAVAQHEKEHGCCG